VTPVLFHSLPQVGDTFILHMFGLRLLFVFSPAGLRSLYKVRCWLSCCQH